MPASDLLLNILSRSDKRAISETADDLDKLGRTADETGKHFRSLADESGHVDRQLAEAKARIRELGAEFDRTGEKTSEFKKKLSSERVNLAWLQKIKKDLEDAGNEGGQGFLSKLTGAISGGLSSGTMGLSSTMTTGLVAGAVVAAPAVTAAVSGAVLLGVGGGALAAGLVGAAQDARVKSAYAELGDYVSRQWQAATGPLVAPLLRGADMLEAKFGRSLPAISRNMEQLAPVVDRLFAGASGFVDKVGPGVGDALRASVPLLNEVADDLPRLGAGVGFFLDRIAASGPGAVAFFHDLTTLIDGSLANLGLLVEAGSKIYEIWHDLPILGSGLIRWLGDLDGGAGKGKKAFFNLKQGSDEFAKSLDDAKQKMRDFVSEALGMQDADLALQRGLFGLTDALKASNGSLDTNTRLGLASREAMQQQIETIARQRKSMIDQGLAIAYVNDWTDRQVQAMYADAQAHGANRAELDRLIGSWRYMLGLDSYKTLTTHVVTVYDTIGAAPGGGHPLGGGRVYGYASGGAVRARAGGGPGGGWFDTGENGPERVYLPENAYVLPNNRMSAAPASGSGDVIGVLEVRHIAPTGEVMRTEFLRLANRRGYRTLDKLLPVGS